MHQLFVCNLSRWSQAYGIFERLAFLDGEILHAARLNESNVIIAHGAVTHVQKQALEDGLVLSEHLSMKTAVERADTTPSTTGGWRNF